MNEKILQNFLDETTGGFRSYKTLAEQAMAQVSDEEFFVTIDAESNSIATICKHVGGNLRSRWSRFLTSDGEKADRNRDAEFVSEGETRASVLQFWESGWTTLFECLQSLTIEDLGKIVQIRGEDFTVPKVINRASMHAASHVGQIQFLAKHLRGADWRTLSIPKNKSAEFNEFLAEPENKNKADYTIAPQKFAEQK